MKTQPQPAWPLWYRLPSVRRQSSTPQVLRVGLAINWLTTILLSLAIFTGVRGLRQGMQTIGKDAAPSIMAAQEIKLDLAALQVQLARLLLGDRDAVLAYEKRRQALTQGLLDAATNIT